MSRSPSGVASLRARFEQNKQDTNTSPPSRGRSPAGSVTSEQSRPISKIRTSFVAVEPSGHMSSNLEVPTAAAGPLDGAQESKIAKSNGAIRKEVGASGGPVAPSMPQDPTTAGKGQSNGLPNGASSAHQDKPASNAKDCTASMPPGDTREESALAGGAVVTEHAQGLGPILKGSPFEDDESKQKTAIPSATAEKPQPSMLSVKGSKGSKAEASAKPPLPGKASNKSRVANSTPSEAHPAQEQTKQVAKPTKSTNQKSMEPSNKASREMPRKGPPQPVQTQKDVITKTNGLKPNDQGHVKSPTGPHTPTSAKAPSEQPAMNATVPSKQAASSSKKPGPPVEKPKSTTTKATDTIKNVYKAPVEAAKSIASKSTVPTSSASESQKKAVPSSSGFTKPRPKSPTKPVKLPSSATAPTASSAAKHDAESGGPPSRSPSRQSSAPMLPKKRTAPLSKPTRPVRASLPANSRPLDKPKPKARKSLAPNSAASGSFLERMMRPTQSSAQKTHEKIEPTSPPRRNTGSATHTTKPKRKSGDSVDRKSEKEEVKPMSTKDQLPEVTEPTDIQAIPLTDNTCEKTNDVAREIEGASPPAHVEV